MRFCARALAASMLVLVCGAAGASAPVAVTATPWTPGNGRLPVLASIPATQPFTFVVMGDNRGSSRGRQPKVFLDILAGIRDAHPAFAVTTGDMINGYSSDETVLRLQWKGYCDALATAGVPVFHAPGNHDINTEGPLSGRLYRELWGPTYYAFDYGSARFIALDTETEAHRIDDAQFTWLEGQFASAGSRRVFLFFHEPLYPVDGHRGSSLDVHVVDRNKLHALFVRHHAVIGGVYQGHEHLYNAQVIDGVPYFISGGGGANLYAAPENGGFHHFLLVSVSSATVLVEVRKYGTGEEKKLSAAAPTLLRPGLLESWEDAGHDAAAWDAWDESVTLERVTDPATQGKRGLKMSFDFDECRWPLLYGTPEPAWNATGIGSLTVDLFVPSGLPGALSVTAQVPGEGKEKYTAPAVALHPGWNAVRTDLTGSWLPAAARSHLPSVEWLLSTDNKKLKGSVVFDNLRAEPPAAGPSTR